MNNYAKKYQKTVITTAYVITKAYDLIELKANGRIDNDGDYIDDAGKKLTYHLYINDTTGCFLTKQDVRDLFSDDGSKSFKFAGIFINSSTDKPELVYGNGFILVNALGEKNYVSKDEFLKTYQLCG